MVKDRLNEFEEIRMKNGFNTPGQRESVALPMDDGHNGDLLSLLEKIGPLYQRTKNLHDDVIKLHKSLNDYSIKEKLGERIDDVRTEAKSLYKAVREVSEYIESDASLIRHVANMHHSSLVTLFSSANAELMKMQAELKDKHKKYVKKELNITGQAVTDEELEELLDKSAEIFNQNIIMETKEAKRRLMDVQQRHDDLVKIEKSIIEVNQLFQDLAILVREQGEKVDRIESYVYEAQEQAHQGQTELRKAQTNQVKSRKKKFIIFGILAVILLIIILSLVYGT